MTLRVDVLRTVAAFRDANPTDAQDVVDELVALGYDPLRAELLAVFVPLGLARAVIGRLPSSSSLRLSKSVIVLDNKRQLTVQLDAVPEFQMARQLGEETFATGVIPRELFSSVVAWSVELKLINQALDARKELRGSTFAPPVLLRLAGAPGFERWYQSTKV